jgi:hypothetical protein
MESGAVFLSLLGLLEVGDIPLGSPRPHQLPPLEDPHQVVDEILGLAVPVDLVGLRIFQPIAASNEAPEVGDVLRV